MSDNNINILIKEEIRSLISEQQTLKFYHVSPEKSITQFRGRYSGKFHTNGLFVTPNFNSIKDDWAGYVAGKKGIHDRSGKRPRYENLTVYTLAIPKDVVKLAKEFWEKKYQEAAATYSDEGLYSSWLWGPELFIPDEYLDQVKIVGKQTFPTEDFFKHTRGYQDPGREYDMVSLAKKLAGTNPAARLYLIIYDARLKADLKYPNKDIIDSFRWQMDVIMKKLQNLLFKAKDFKYTPIKSLSPEQRTEYKELLKSWYKLQNSLDS